MARLVGTAAWSGSALALSGSGRVALPAMSLSGGSLTIAAWVYVTSDYQMPIIELDSSAATLTFGVHGQHAKLALKVGANDPVTASWILSGSNFLAADAWQPQLRSRKGDG